jgi:uncharacterized protein (TIGR00251 family)
VRVAVLVSPRSAQDQVVGGVIEANGKQVLKIAVRAAPEGGKANDAVIEVLAKAVRLPRRDLALKSGAASRRKTVLVSGDPAQLLPRLDALLAFRG